MVPNDCVILLARLWIQLLRRYCTGIFRDTPAQDIWQNISQIISFEIGGLTVLLRYNDLRIGLWFLFNLLQPSENSAVLLFFGEHIKLTTPLLFLSWFDAFYWPEAVWRSFSFRTNKLLEAFFCIRYYLHLYWLYIIYVLKLCWELQQFITMSHSQ